MATMEKRLTCVSQEFNQTYQFPVYFIHNFLDSKNEVLKEVVGDRPFKENKKIIVFIVLLAGMASGVLIGAFSAFTRDLPQIRALETFRPQAVTRIYSAEKQLLAELYLEKRDPVLLESIPS